ncbi:MAG: hypothetical protein H6672_01305 [Anaerolineaceae bacterium]|nr:hypothetical protein [Anaerolineaceae bacterium]
MIRQLYGLLTLVVILAACQPESVTVAPFSTAVPFPTVTPGQLLHGILPTPDALRGNGGALANPATAMALANRATPTPQYGVCPPGAEPPFPSQPTAQQDRVTAIARFLSDGGSIPALDTLLYDQWGLLDETSTFRSDLDFTGGGTGNILLAYTTPETGGALLVLGCANGRYIPLYDVLTGGDFSPQIIFIGDMNYDGVTDLLYTAYGCSTTSSEDCTYETQLLTWDQGSGRFTSLFSRPITSAEPPTPSDIDSDQVQEVVVRLTNTGTAATGPLRTGVNIYDWNGVAYVLSITQLDPPRFKIQVIHEADDAFNRLEIEDAVSLYELANSDSGLRYWFNDEPDILRSYALYRLVVAFAYTEDDRLLPTYQAALQNELDPATAPVYTLMTTAFWDAFQSSYNMHSACAAVQSVIAVRPEAVGLLNRYGSRSPTYTAGDLCPF